MSWEEAWQEGRTGWDAGEAAPALVDYLGTLPQPQTGVRALVPGCGSGYDAFALAKAGYFVEGLDIAPTAAARFERVRKEQGLSVQEAVIVNDDFFERVPEQPYDVVWDYTFLCAIEPQMRQAWAKTMWRIVADDGELWTLIFPVNPNNATPSTKEDKGPPYRMHPEVVKGLLDGLFEPIEITPVTRSHPGREGKEFFGRWKKVTS